MNDAEFLKQFVAKLAQSEPPKGQERVQEPPSIEDWGRYKEILRRLVEGESE